MTHPDNRPKDAAAPAPVKVRSAGALDIRSIIGALIGLYGLILVAAGLWFTDTADKKKADGENLNLMVGVGLLVFAVLFIAWVILRPLQVPVHEDQ
jgi:uncharacterized membrane protein YidH (DUF202 family)